MDDYKLLKNIYKHLDIDKLLKAEPALDRIDIDEFFRKIRDSLGIRKPGGKSRIDELHLYTDGAARGNPGPAAIGCVLKDKNGNTLLEEGKVIGNATNNVAEYQALIHGLELAVQFTPESLSIFSDSQLLVKQLTGVYKTKDRKLRSLKKKVMAKLQQFKNHSITAISREMNADADSLANEALDK